MTAVNKTVSECDEKYLAFNCSFVFDVVQGFSTDNYFLIKSVTFLPLLDNESLMVA